MNRFKHGSRPLARVLLGVAAAILVGCGGGTEQIEPFAPTRIMAFGDEASTITPLGKKYTVNAVDTTTGALLCYNNQVWTQSLASSFGMVFPQCNPENIAAPQGQMFAQAGAKVGDVRDQLDKFFATGSFNPKDLVAMMAGTNDLLELYSQFPAQSRDSLINTATERGKLWGQQVNRVADAGGRVIVPTLPDLGVTPFAFKEQAAKQDTDRAKLLTDLTAAFNTSMRLTIRNDGRLIGLVLGDEMVQSIARFPAAFGYANVTDAACLGTVAATDCTTKTLLADATAESWLWATDTMLGAAGQSRLGTLAQTRAKSNPF